MIGQLVRRLGVGEAVAASVHERFGVAMDTGKRQSALVVERPVSSRMRCVARGCRKEFVEGHACCFLVSPLSFSKGVGHPQGYLFVLRVNTQIGPAAVCGGRGEWCDR